MNFQEKMIETSALLRERAAERVQGFRKSLDVLNDAGRELHKVARLHAGRFVKQNSPLVAAVRKDVSNLARNTFVTLTSSGSGKPSKTFRKAATSRKRARKTA